MDGKRNPVLKEFDNMHYDAVSTLGEATLYDGALFHGGMSNNATVPPMTLALTICIEPRATMPRHPPGP